MSGARIVAVERAVALTAGLVAATLVLGLPGSRPAAADGEARPAVTVVPAERRLRRVSALARDTVRELDGKARARVLREMISAAREAGALRRWALELQSVVDDHKQRRNGDYLHRLYLALRRDSARRAFVLADELACEGVAIGPSSGHFQTLSHIDPTAPLPSAPANINAAAASMDRWVDAFVRADYDLGYRPNRRGALSEILQLTYADGVVLDIDIQVIGDSYDPAPAHAMAYAYVGPGERVFPLRLGRSTTPRLWLAKHALALAAMYRSNQDYETFASISVAGTMTNLPLGLVVPVHPPTPRVSARTAPHTPHTGARAQRRPPTATRRATSNMQTPRLTAPPGRKLAQQIARYRAAGGSGGRAEFLQFANGLAARARTAGNAVTGRVGTGAYALENATISREGSTYIVTDRAGVIRSFVPKATPGEGIVLEYLKLGGTP